LERHLRFTSGEVPKQEKPEPNEKDFPTCYTKLCKKFTAVRNELLDIVVASPSGKEIHQRRWKVTQLENINDDLRQLILASD
jgi:endo-alpha-1,4-polygalactosaminidase (GH114 family)